MSRESIVTDCVNAGMAGIRMPVPSAAAETLTKQEGFGMTTNNLHLSTQLFHGAPRDKFDAAARKSFLATINRLGGTLTPVISPQEYVEAQIRHQLDRMMGEASDGLEPDSCPVDCSERGAP